MVARTLGVMAAAEERLQQPSPKRTRSEQPVSHGCLSGRQWVDVQRAARIASATNVQLTVHGIVVDGFAARQQQQIQQLQPQLQGANTVPSACRMADLASSTRSTIVADEAPPRTPTSRQRRSQRRLQEYQKAKTALAEKRPPLQQQPQQPPQPSALPSLHVTLEGVRSPSISLVANQSAVPAKPSLTQSPTSTRPPPPTAPTPTPTLQPPPSPSPMPPPPPTPTQPPPPMAPTPAPPLIAVTAKTAVPSPPSPPQLPSPPPSSMPRLPPSALSTEQCGGRSAEGLGRFASQPIPSPLSPLSPSPHSLTLQPTPLQPTALATRPIPKPPSPIAEDLHEKIAARVKEDRMNYIKNMEEWLQGDRNRLKTPCGGYVPPHMRMQCACRPCRACVELRRG